MIDGADISKRGLMRGFWGSISDDALFLDQALVTWVHPLCENGVRWAL